MMFLSFYLGNYIADNFIAEIWTLRGMQLDVHSMCKPSFACLEDLQVYFGHIEKYYSSFSQNKL